MFGRWLLLIHPVQHTVPLFCFSLKPNMIWFFYTLYLSAPTSSSSYTLSRNSNSSLKKPSKSTPSSLHLDRQTHSSIRKVKSASFSFQSYWRPIVEFFQEESKPTRKPPFALSPPLITLNKLGHSKLYSSHLIIKPSEVKPKSLATRCSFYGISMVINATS